MNNTADYPSRQIKAQLECAESSTGLLKAFTSAAKMLFESAEHAAGVAVVLLMVALAVISLTKIVDSGTCTDQYCKAISKVVVQ